MTEPAAAVFARDPPRGAAMRTETFDATELLTAQHKEVDAMFVILESNASAATKQATLNKLADSLAAHMAIEENIFYPAIINTTLEDKLHEAVEEHLAAKRVLVDLLALAVADDQFDAKISVLKEELDHHNHEEEEEKLFPKVRKMLSIDTLRGLGSEMLAMFETMMATEPRLTLHAQTKRAATLPPV